jgi:hypothetical protein
MRSLTRQPTTEAQAFFAQERCVPLWPALPLLLGTLNIAAVTLSLLAY